MMSGPVLATEENHLARYTKKIGLDIQLDNPLATFLKSLEHSILIEKYETKQFDCLNYFHQAPTTLLNDPQSKLRILKKLLMMLEESVNAIHAFLSTDLTKFDPHIGETACQLRAYRLQRLWMSRDKLKDEYLAEKSNILRLIIRTIELIEKHKVLKNSQRDIRTLAEFIVENELHFSISQNWAFLTMAYFITRHNKWSQDSTPAGVDYNELANTLRDSKNSVIMQVRHFQKILSEDSCDFVFNLIGAMPDLAKKRMEVLLSLRRVGENGKSVLPCYGAMEVLISHIIRSNSLVCLLVQTSRNEIMKFLFMPAANDDFVLVDETHFTEAPCFVVLGYTDNDDKELVLDDISSGSLKDILLSNMASHPQYSGEVLQKYRNAPALDIAPANNMSAYLLENYVSDYYSMRMKARAMGCSLDSPSLFFVKHIYCDLVKNIFPKKSQQFSNVEPSVNKSPLFISQ